MNLSCSGGVADAGDIGELVGILEDAVAYFADLVGEGGLVGGGVSGVVVGEVGLGEGIAQGVEELALGGLVPPAGYLLATLFVDPETLQMLTSERLFMV